MVRAAGLEPARPRPRDFKSLAFTSFATPASPGDPTCGGPAAQETGADCGAVETNNQRLREASDDRLRLYYRLESVRWIGHEGHL